MRPEDYQPPLTWWSHTWRLLVMLGISAAAWLPRSEYQYNHFRWWFVIDLALGAATFVAVWWRRKYPVAVCTFANLATIVSASSGGAGALAMVSLSTRRRWTEIAGQVVLALVCGTLSEYRFGVPSTEAVPLIIQSGFLAAIIAVMVGWGMYIGSRRELLASWRSRAMLAEEQQQSQVAQVRSVERARIAREMHDVVAHRISTVSMFSGALAYRTDLSPEQVREGAQTIEENSRLALTELREVLGVLREGPGDADPEHPQVGPTDVDDLVASATATGMRVHYTRTADLAPVAASTVRTLYRCLQEGLTNARKHAPATVVAVRIEDGRDGGIDLLVANPMVVGGSDRPVPRSGLGLIGIAERVELSGGRQSATSTDDKMFVLHVWLPAR